MGKIKRGEKGTAPERVRKLLAELEKEDVL